MAVTSPSKPVRAGAATLVCPRNGTATRLTCVRCGTPICPACLVRTPVGMKCPDCAAITAPRPVARRRARPLVALVAAVATGLATPMVAGALRGGGGSPPEPETAEETVVPTPVQPRNAVIGEELTIGPFAVTVTRFECPGRDTDPSIPAVAPGGRVCLAQLRVRNHGLQPVAFPSGSQRVTDGVRRFAPAVADRPGNQLTPAPVNPEAVVDGVLVFHLPENVAPTGLELRPSLRRPPIVVALPA